MEASGKKSKMGNGEKGRIFTNQESNAFLVAWPSGMDSFPKGKDERPSFSVGSQTSK